VIAGHPTIYTGRATYSVPSSGGDLNTSNGFSVTKNYAQPPDISAAKMKGTRPEEGGFSIGSCTVELLDKYTDAHNTLREFTDLASRWSYLEGNQTGTETSLSADITSSATTINLVSTTGIVAGDVIHISQEAILVGTVASGTQLTGCTRGYLLTLAVPHLAEVKVYGYLPSLYRRIFYVFKGYQGVPLSSWLKAWGGVIDGVNHDTGKLTLHAQATTWEMFGGRSRAGKPGNPIGIPRGSTGGTSIRKIVRLPEIGDDSNGTAEAEASTPGLAGDYRLTLLIPNGVSVTDGHFLARLGDSWLGLCSDGPAWDPSLPNEIVGSTETVLITAAVRLGVGDPDLSWDAGDTFDFAWSNAVFTASASPGGNHLDPIELLLKFLVSTGAGTNGAYDVFSTGIGLGIPEALIDVDSFTGVIAARDYDDNLRTLFVFTKPEGGKDFVEQELCKPFGWYIATGNDGRIKLVRSKNPTKLYFSRANNTFTLTHSSSSHVRSYQIPAGVYTAAEAASTLKAGLDLITGQTWTVSPSAGVFTLSVAAGTFSFGTSNAWATIGHTSAASSVSSKAGNVAVAQFSDTSSSGDYNVIDENDCTAVDPIDSLPSRIAEVWYSVNYDWSAEEFRVVKTFTDAEVANLDGEVEPYVIESKGLVSAFSRAKRIPTPWLVKGVPDTEAGCMGQDIDVSSSFGLDASNSFASLFTSHLFDRYRGQPIRFKCRLAWKFNRLEVGDNVQFSYAIDGVFADYEIGAGVVTSRVFEVVSIKPNLAGGYVEAELLGHRSG